MKKGFKDMLVKPNEEYEAWICSLKERIQQALKHAWRLTLS